MALTTSSVLSNEIKTLYDADYLIAGQSNLYWDQFTDPKEISEGERGKTYEVPILENINPTTSPLVETDDVVAQALSASTTQITMQEWGAAIELTRFLTATAYVDVYQQAAYANGYSMAETFDLIARAVYGQGKRRILPSGLTARSGVAGLSTSGHRISAKVLTLIMMFARTARMPLYEDNAVATVMHPFPYYDLLQDTTIQNLAQYQHPEMLFNGEISYYSGIRFILSANAKVFPGAGAAATSAASTTLAAPINAGDATITVASATNIAVGMWLNIIDTAEPGNTWCDTNEMFYVTGISGTDITGWCLDPGPGDDGGFRYAHASGKAVNNANSVYPMVVFGPKSIKKAYSSFTGPYGESVVTGPFDKLGRFLNFGWYQIMGYARTRNPWLMRYELGSSLA